MPVFLAGAMDQALKAAEWAAKRGQQGKLPIAVIHQKGQHFDNALVVMRLSDFRDRFEN